MLLGFRSSSSRPRTTGRRPLSAHKSDRRSRSPARRGAVEETYADRGVSPRASRADCKERRRKPAETAIAGRLERLAVWLTWSRSESEPCCDRCRRRQGCASSPSRGSSPRPASNCTWPAACSAWTAGGWFDCRARRLKSFAGGTDALELLEQQVIRIKLKVSSKRAHISCSLESREVFSFASRPVPGSKEANWSAPAVMIVSSTFPDSSAPSRWAFSDRAMTVPFSVHRPARRPRPHCCCCWCSRSSRWCTPAAGEPCWWCAHRFHLARLRRSSTAMWLYRNRYPMWAYKRERFNKKN